VDSGIAWQYQVLLGAFFEVVIMAVWANVNGAYRQHREIVRQLNDTRESIIGYRENSATSLAGEQEKLIEQAQQTLLPQLQRVESAIAAGGTDLSSRWGTASELRAIIFNQVRPLFESLTRESRKLVAPVKPAPSQFFSVVSIPKSFRLQNSIFPGLSFIASLVSFLALPFWILDINWVSISLGLSITYFLALLGIKKMLNRAPAISAWLGVPALIAIALISVVPAYSAAVFFYPDTEAAVFYGLALVWMSLAIVISFALLDSFDYGAKNYVELLKAENIKLNHEAAIFEQQLWEVRKNWSLLLHGTVQASLTAALTRLNSSDADSKSIDLAKRDLDRAIKALSQVPTTTVKLTPALRELVATWAGVCEVEIEMEPDLKKDISRSPRMSMCLNEILKEAVSNAVRHGDAERAWVEVSRIGEKDAAVVEVQVTNDGRIPVTGERRGLGSKLLDELTLDWSLNSEPETGRTILAARLPFSGVQA
jgi:signal transduction histidine kinase